MSSKAGKIKIKPFKVQTLMNRDAAQEAWRKLERAIDEIYNRNSSALYFEELYRTAYNLVLHKHGEMLYEGVKACFRDHALSTCGVMKKVADSNLLSELCIAWEDNKTTITKIKDIVMYMDNTFVAHQKMVPVYNSGVRIFREVILYDSTIREKVRRLLLQNVLAERNGEIIDIEAMKGALNMLIELGVDGTRVYEEDFEELFLSATKSFYREEYLMYSAQFSCPDYIKKVEKRFFEEANRVNRYLSKTTEPKLRAILNSELISDHAESLVEMDYSGCRNMIKENQVDDLKGLFDMLNRVPICLEYVHSSMNSYVKSCGCDILAEYESSKEVQPLAFVQSVIQLKIKMDNIVKICFRSESNCMRALKEAFEYFLNKDHRPAAFLAIYFDDLLKNGLKGCSDAESEDKIDHAIAIFRHIFDKDVFESYYKTHLSKRLLSKNFSDELEKNVINKLKSECGYQYTGKIEGMFLDIGLSNTLHDDYSTECEKMGANLSNVHFDVTVLTAGVWPSTCMNSTCVLPQLIQEMCLDPFTAFYVRKHSGRKLTWQLQLGGAEVIGKFGKARRDLSVSTYQMCILMMFNQLDSCEKSPTLAFSEIKDTLQISTKELSRHLLSLCTPKHRVLLKSSKGKTITEGDTFEVNFEFTSKLRRVKIPLISLKDASISGEKASGRSRSVEDFDQVPANVLEDRRHIIEAAIVRIMKARKVMSHNDLVAEVLRQVTHRFPLEVPSLKKRIESLIDREYIMRDPDSRKMYKYLA